MMIIILTHNSKVHPSTAKTSKATVESLSLFICTGDASVVFRCFVELLLVALATDVIGVSGARDCCVVG